MNVFGPCDGFTYGNEKVVGLGVEFVKGLEVDGTVGTGPAWS